MLEKDLGECTLLRITMLPSLKHPEQRPVACHLPSSPPNPQQTQAPTIAPDGAEAKLPTSLDGHRKLWRKYDWHQYSVHPLAAPLVLWLPAPCLTASLEAAEPQEVVRGIGIGSYVEHEYLVGTSTPLATAVRQALRWGHTPCSASRGTDLRS